MDHFFTYLNVLDISPLSWEGILCCVFCGFVIGFERQLFQKVAGIRTSILICMSTYIFVLLSTVVLNDVTDPSRVIGQVVTGVGFLGAGVMFFSKEGALIGVTSAAIIWLLASLGCMIALGYYRTPIIMSLLVVFILLAISILDKFILKMKNVGEKEGDD